MKKNIIFQNRTTFLTNYVSSSNLCYDANLPKYVNLRTEKEGTLVNNLIIKHKASNWNASYLPSCWELSSKSTFFSINYYHIFSC